LYEVKHNFIITFDVKWLYIFHCIYIFITR